jgi:DNA invertase Pin-like site-specific DNA recombinase
VSKGLKERAAQGLWVGPVPFGYAKDDDGSPEIISGEAEAVQQVFSMYSSGNKTYREIATWLRAYTRPDPGDVTPTSAANCVPVIR